MTNIEQAQIYRNAAKALREESEKEYSHAAELTARHMEKLAGELERGHVTIIQ